MSDPPANDVAPELSSSSGSDSDSEAWVTAYDSEFEMTLSDIDEDLLNAMRNFDVGEGPPGHAGMLRIFANYGCAQYFC